MRLVIIDDNPFVRTNEGIRPRAATFHRFAEAVAEVGPFRSVAYCVPVAELRPGEQPPIWPAVDERHLTIVPTAAFSGAADYLLRFPLMWLRNRPTLLQAIGQADLVWIKAPASNALLAARVCRLLGVRRFAYVVSSARAVIEGQDRGGFAGFAARMAASFYDWVTSWLIRTGPAVMNDAELFTSVVDEADAAETDPEMPEHQEGSPWRIVWAGRLAAEKGVGDLLGAAASLRVRGRPVELILLGEGPARPELEVRAEHLGLTDLVTWVGFVAEPHRYMELLRSADLFVLPSRAEGVPKSLVEAMAAGVPAIATRSGQCAAILGDGSRGMLVEPGDVEGLARAIGLVMDDPRGRAARRGRALTWAWQHTRRAQARRLVAWMARTFPELFAARHIETEGRILPAMKSAREQE